jgi:hypothetical protein
MIEIITMLLFKATQAATLASLAQNTVLYSSHVRASLRSIPEGRVFALYDVIKVKIAG